MKEKAKASMCAPNEFELVDWASWYDSLERRNSLQCKDNVGSPEFHPKRE